MPAGTCAAAAAGSVGRICVSAGLPKGASQPAAAAGVLARWLRAACATHDWQLAGRASGGWLCWAASGSHWHGVCNRHRQHSKYKVSLVWAGDCLVAMQVI
jgi:hypothetical protein